MYYNNYNNSHLYFQIFYLVFIHKQTKQIEKLSTKESKTRRRRKKEHFKPKITTTGYTNNSDNYTKRKSQQQQRLQQQKTLKLQQNISNKI